jgi:methionyl-tRNA formyltransferase
MAKPKVAIFGCKNTTRFLLDFLSSIQFVDVLVTISPEDAKKNEVADYADLRTYAASKGLAVYVASNYSLKNETDIAALKELSIDIAFVMGWQRLLPEKVLGNLRIGAFGMHGSSMDLPLGRGRSPMNWSIIEGRKVFYTNLFKYDPGVDSGDVVDTFKFSSTERDTAETMHYKNMLAMKHLIEKNKEQLEAGNLKLQPQRKDITPTYYPKRTPEDSQVDWGNDIFSIERFIRAVTRPFNGAFSFIRGEKVTIYDAQILDLQDFGYTNADNATVVEVLSDSKFLVKGYGGLLLVNEYESEAVICQGDRFEQQDSLRSFAVNRFGFHDLPE